MSDYDVVEIHGVDRLNDPWCSTEMGLKMIRRGGEPIPCEVTPDGLVVTGKVTYLFPWAAIQSLRLEPKPAKGKRKSGE